MFEISLAEGPFKYQGNAYDDYYNYFVLKVDSLNCGLLKFDLMTTTLTQILLDDPDQYYDVFIRAALHYFSQKGYQMVTLDGPDFDTFKRRYLLNGVFEGKKIKLDPFFDMGCES
jgi:hypothetical protein